ncbi:MAG: hypothetical protein A2V78_02500 [Betaproteobacteria bacterium RBG_16_64_18]|nr:MAG: hypothetical protein A2V78_02500 [Betaproteobacteria bacterium RBG_16_64_18]
MQQIIEGVKHWWNASPPWARSFYEGEYPCCAGVAKAVLLFLAKHWQWFGTAAVALFIAWYFRAPGR